MRLIHTSDWHLGRSFHQVGLLGAQAAYLDSLVDVVRRERVDAVLVSGDVYDRAMPSPETVDLLSQSLVRLVDAGAQVVVSSGNHDSAIRLGFASGLLERAGLHLRTSVADVGRPVLVGDVAVHPLPYLEPALAADALGATERTHAGVLRAAMARVRADAGRRGGAHRRHGPRLRHRRGRQRLRARHLRRGRVGGAAGGVRRGRLHRPRPPARPAAGRRGRALQRLTGRDVVLRVGATARGACSSTSPATTPVVEHVEAPVERPLALLRGTLDELLTDPAHRGAEAAWCQVTLTDPQRPLGAMEQVRRRFPFTLVLRFDPQGATVPLRSYAARVATATDVEVCCDFLGARPRRPRGQRRRAGAARRGRRGQPARPPGR